MKVIVNKPVPVPTPPTTYDLVGLTADEFKVLKYSLGRTNSDDASMAGCNDTFVGYHLYDKLVGVVVADEESPF